MATIVLDAGHGGNDLGDAYGHRYEKDDNLRLTLAVGRNLENYGYEVVYIRVIDIYIYQTERAKIANNANGDFLLSIHRISGDLAITEAGLVFYVDTLGGVAEKTAINIAEQLKPLGFESYNIIVLTDNILFRYADMPSLLISIGYLNSEYDNWLFDTRLNDIAYAIARGIYETIPINDTMTTKENNENNENNMKTYENNSVSNTLYGVQVGQFSDSDDAQRLNNILLQKGYPSQVVYTEPYYYVRVGESDDLDLAAYIELYLRFDGFNTSVVII